MKLVVIIIHTLYFGSIETQQDVQVNDNKYKPRNNDLLFTSFVIPAKSIYSRSLKRMGTNCMPFVKEYENTLIWLFSVTRRAVFCFSYNEQGRSKSVDNAIILKKSYTLISQSVYVLCLYVYHHLSWIDLN